MKQTCLHPVPKDCILKTAGVDKNPFEIALVDRYESCACPLILFLCVQIHYRLQRLINNPSLLSLSSFQIRPESALVRALVSSGGNIDSVCSLIGFEGAIRTDVSVVPMWIRFLEGPRKTEAIRSFSKWPLGPWNGFHK